MDLPTTGNIWKDLSIYISFILLICSIAGLLHYSFNILGEHIREVASQECKADNGIPIYVKNRYYTCFKEQPK